MKFNIRFTIAAVIPLALAACGAEIEQTRGLQPTGSEFDKALFQGYLVRAEHESGYGHVQSADAFAIKAQAAASGQSVEPFTPNDDAYPPGRVPESDLSAMQAGRQALLDVFVKNAKTKAPKDAAVAQVNFDCWVEEQSYIGTFFEDDQPDHAKGCRDVFESALALAQEAVKPPPPPPAPKPVAAPVATVPSDYLAFFDWAQDVLTPEARQIVQEAAANFGKGDFTTVRVIGHTDSSGPAEYNVDLSRRRAANAADELVRQGVPEDKIDISWKGQTQLRVASGDEVREPQNRRVEIEFE